MRINNVHSFSTISFNGDYLAQLEQAEVARAFYKEVENYRAKYGEDVFCDSLQGKVEVKKRIDLLKM